MSTKQLYYVSVSGKSVDAAESMGEQLQVRATEQEASELQLLLNLIGQDDRNTAIKAPVPYKSADHDPATDKFNEDIVKVYRAIYELGTDRTREHIRSMNIIQELKNPDFHHAGYNEDKSIQG
ncbi:hypothetical protein ACFO9Q_05190 [Paenibacillus sp. GCM10023252]|uniref:hypothetical protein n=1 Tax=Paenibacillus sp. GCM10023252 TaxID=3252649 RepID=UPI00360BCDD6